MDLVEEGIYVDVSFSDVVRELLVVVLSCTGRAIGPDGGSLPIQTYNSARVKQIYASTYHGLMS